MSSPICFQNVFVPEKFLENVSKTEIEQNVSETFLINGSIEVHF